MKKINIRSYLKNRAEKKALKLENLRLRFLLQNTFTKNRRIKMFKDIRIGEVVMIVGNSVILIKKHLPFQIEKNDDFSKKNTRNAINIQNAREYSIPDNQMVLKV